MNKSYWKAGIENIVLKKRQKKMANP